MSSTEPSNIAGQAPLARYVLKVTPGNIKEFEDWRQTISPVYEFDIPDQSRLSDYALDASGCIFSSLSLARAMGSASIFDRTSRVIAQSGIDWITVMTYTKGHYALTMDGDTRRIEPGDFIILDMSRPFCIVADDYENISLNIPRQALEPLLPGIDAAHGLIIPRSVIFNTLLLNHLTMLLNRVDDFTVNDSQKLAQITSNLIAACIDATLESKDQKLGLADFSTLQKLRRTIEAQLDNPKLGVKMLAAEHGISRSALYRIFEPLEGVQSYIQQRRLARIYQTITNPAFDDEKIGLIAQRYGFKNATNFSRAFRAVYGVSPTEARRRSRQGGTEIPKTVNSYSYASVKRWVQGLDSSPGVIASPSKTDSPLS